MNLYFLWFFIVVICECCCGDYVNVKKRKLFVSKIYFYWFIKYVCGIFKKKYLIYNKLKVRIIFYFVCYWI